MIYYYEIRFTNMNIIMLIIIGNILYFIYGVFLNRLYFTIGVHIL